MAAQGAAMQNHNNELVRCIEDLREKRGEIDRQIRDDEQVRKEMPVPIPFFHRSRGPLGERCARTRSRPGCSLRPVATSCAFVYLFVSFFYCSPIHPSRSCHETAGTAFEPAHACWKRGSPPCRRRFQLSTVFIHVLLYLWSCL